VTYYDSTRLSRAVASICPDIRDRVTKAVITFDERRLWWELSSCILSSQVPYSLSVAAANAIDNDDILHDKRVSATKRAKRLEELLSAPLAVDGKQRAYRFPVARARQLAAAHSLVTDTKSSLGELVHNFETANEARIWFVKHVPGIGPKQASMFLRNAGVSYDLAILDRHVLSYMTKLGMYSGDNYSISGLAQYRRHEEALIKHAQELDCPVGLLDWAIWIVMRVANRASEVTAA
jgi:N-glycosylase/DNA lyase